MSPRNGAFSIVVLTCVFFLPNAIRAGDPALIDVKKLAPGIQLDLRYATENNFTGRKLYPVAECLLCEPAAKRLARVQRNLEKQNLGLKIWDCYRPHSIQKELWEIVPDARYVANPKTGSRHNRGASIDLTLVDKNGNELPMPTAYDDFSEKAHRSNMDLPEQVIANRELLKDAMMTEGFIPIQTEWWHFDAPEWQEYALRDEPLGSPALRSDIKSKTPVSEHLQSSSQALVVRSTDWSDKAATLQRYEKSGSTWKAVGEPWTVGIGSKGMSWGYGLQPYIEEGPQKREGDMTATAGVFKLGASYGYSKTPPEKTNWPYHQVNERWVCVDDPVSQRYNEVFEPAADTKKDWARAETMLRKDQLYKWVINIDQNMPATAGCGSCIFLHVWRRPGGTTEGCTAMEEKDMVTLLQWLKPEASPLMIQLPTKIYDKFKPDWKLP